MYTDRWRRRSRVSWQIWICGKGREKVSGWLRYRWSKGMWWGGNLRDWIRNHNLLHVFWNPVSPITRTMSSCARTKYLYMQMMFCFPKTFCSTSSSSAVFVQIKLPLMLWELVFGSSLLVFCFCTSTNIQTRWCSKHHHSLHPAHHLLTSHVNTWNQIQIPCFRISGSTFLGWTISNKASGSQLCCRWSEQQFLHLFLCAVT